MRQLFQHARVYVKQKNQFFEAYIIYLYVNIITESENDHFNSRKLLCKRCNTDIKEKLTCEIYKLITASGLPLVINYLLFYLSPFL